jgi:hypothetical protein
MPLKRGVKGVKGEAKDRVKSGWIYEISLMGRQKRNFVANEKLPNSGHITKWTFLLFLVSLDLFEVYGFKQFMTLSCVPWRNFESSKPNYLTLFSLLCYINMKKAQLLSFNIIFSFFHYYFLNIFFKTFTSFIICLFTSFFLTYPFETFLFKVKLHDNKV